MLDMSQTIAVKSDQLNADDLIGRSMTITITKVVGNDSAEQPVSVYFEGDGGKPFKPCKTVRRLMVAAWGKEAAKYVGRSMTLYRDASVKFGGMEVGGIRVSHMSHIDGKLVVALMASKGKKRPIEVMPLKAEVHRHPASQQADEPTLEQRADAYIGALKRCATVEQLAKQREKARGLVTQLHAEAPDLYARVIEADPASELADSAASVGAED